MADESVIPFSLHCTICYEPFDVAGRVPVILPCGHTYLCEPCSKRLRTCMECRTPLYMVPPPPKPPPSSGYSPSYRYSPRSPRSTDSSRQSSPANTNSPRQEPVQFPIPKNLVLIALLEAAQQTCQSELKDKDYESGDDDEHVLVGMNLLSSDYGTYVVREQKGLHVHSCLSEIQERLPLEDAGESSENFARESSLVTGEAPSQSAPPVVCPDAFLPSSTLDEDIESVDLQDSTCVDAIPSNRTLVSRPSDEITCTDESLLQPTLKDDEHAGEQEKVLLHLRPQEIKLKNEIVLLQDTRKKDENAEQDTRKKDENTEEQEEKILFRLSFGQTVQLVSFVDGVGKLARGRGYVAATSKQLVKVGDPLDNACKLEGILSAVEKKQQLLREKLQDLDTVESDLNCKLKEALLEPDNDAFTHAPGLEDLISVSSSSLAPSPLNIRETTDSLDVNLSDPDLFHENSESAEFDNFVFSVTSARNEQERPKVLLKSFERQPCEGAGANYYACTGNIMQNIFPGEAATVSPLYDVRRPRSSSVREGIDWSTGLSGHMGLTSASGHRKPKRREIRMMGEHRGIANIRRIRPATGSSPTLGNPSW